MIQSDKKRPENKAKSHKAHPEQGGAGGLGEGIYVAGDLLDEARGDNQREGGAKARNSELKAHREGHGPASEPFCDAASDGRAGNFTAKAEEHDADISRSERAFAAVKQRRRHDPGPENHHSDEQRSADADTPLVKEDSAYDEPSEDAQDAIAAGVQPVARSIPSQHCQRSIFKQVGDA